MAICSSGSPAHCCQPAVAGGVIYADLWGEFNTHLALQALFTQSSPVRKPLLQAFPFPSTQGEVTLHLLSWPACLFTAHVGSGSSPLSCGVFLPPPLSQAFPFLVAGHAPLPLPSPAWPSFFIYSSRRDSPPPFSALRAPHPLCYVSLLFLLLIIQFLFFSPGGGRSVQGLCCSGLWPRIVCGSTVYRLAHLVCIFPSCLGVGNWRRPRGSPGFSVQCEVEMLCAGWRCGGVKVLTLLSGLACKVCLQHLSKISL
jgi:hypothetical protein